MITETTMETSVPLPVKENAWRERLDALEIKGSFSFSRDKRSSVANAVTEGFHNNPHSVKQFTISADPENPDFYCRVWRIEDHKEAE